MSGHKGPKITQRFMSEGQMNTIALYVFLCIPQLTKVQPRMVGGLDLAHGLLTEKPCTIFYYAFLLLIPGILRSLS